MHLILGGVRSGKSAFAESLAAAHSGPVTYLATATADDGEMQARVDRHKQRRPEAWNLLEEPLQVAAALSKIATQDGLILLDCLTLWVTNLLLAEDQTALDREIEALLAAAPTLPGQLLLVSNEVGMGIVPMGELSRRFGDVAGELHQALAAQADTVTLVVAGLPHYLKGQADVLV